MVNTRGRPAPEYFLTKESALQIYGAALDKEDFAEIGRLYKLFRNVIRNYPPLSYCSAPKPPTENTCAEISTKIFAMIDIIFSTIQQLPWNEPPPEIEATPEEDDAQMASVMSQLGVDSDDEDDIQVRDAAAGHQYRSVFNQTGIDRATADEGLSGPLSALSIEREDSAVGSGLSGPPHTISRLRHQSSQLSKSAAEAAMRPAGEAPIRPAAEAAIRPAGEAPIRPAAEAAIRPAGEAPIRPAAEAAILHPAGEAPILHPAAEAAMQHTTAEAANYSFSMGEAYSRYPQREQVRTNGTQSTAYRTQSQQQQRHVSDSGMFRSSLGRPRVQLASTRIDDRQHQTEHFAQFTPSPIYDQGQNVQTRSAVEEMSMVMGQAFQQMIQQSTQQQAEVTLAGSGFERFDGSCPGDFKSWLFGLENRLKLTKTRDDEVKVGHLVNCLAGLARRQFHEDLSNPSYAEAIVYLKNKYTDTKYNALKFQQFRSRFQRRGESIQMFARDLKLTFPFNNIDKQQSNLMLMEQLQRGVQEQDYKLYVQEHLLNPKKTFDDVVEKLALRELAKETADVKVKQEKTKDRVRDEYNIHYCFKCRRKTDHIGEQCPHNKHETAQQQQYGVESPKQQSAPSQRPIQCYKCQSIGHYASECNNKRVSAGNSQGKKIYSARSAQLDDNQHQSCQHQKWQSTYAPNHGEHSHCHHCECVLSHQPDCHDKCSDNQQPCRQTSESGAPKCMAQQTEGTKPDDFSSSTKSAVGTVTVEKPARWYRAGAARSENSQEHARATVFVNSEKIGDKLWHPDTGAQINLVTIDFMTSVVGKKIDNSCSHTLTCVNDLKTKCCGFVKLAVSIGKLTKKLPFHVIEKFQGKVGLVLGMPALHEFGFSLKNDCGIDITPKVSSGKDGSFAGLIQMQEQSASPYRFGLLKEEEGGKPMPTPKRKVKKKKNGVYWKKFEVGSVNEKSTPISVTLRKCHEGSKSLRKCNEVDEMLRKCHKAAEMLGKCHDDVATLRKCRGIEEKLRKFHNFNNMVSPCMFSSSTGVYSNLKSWNPGLENSKSVLRSPHERLKQKSVGSDRQIPIQT